MATLTDDERSILAYLEQLRRDDRLADSALTTATAAPTVPLAAQRRDDYAGSLPAPLDARRLAFDLLRQVGAIERLGRQVRITDHGRALLAQAEQGPA